MKIILIASMFLGTAFAQNYQYIQGYQRRDGTYVQGHMRSRLDSYEYNNIKPDYSPSNNYGIHKTGSSFGDSNYNNYNNNYGQQRKRW